MFLVGFLSLVGLEFGVESYYWEKSWEQNSKKEEFGNKNGIANKYMRTVPF